MPRGNKSFLFTTTDLGDKCIQSNEKQENVSIHRRSVENSKREKVVSDNIDNSREIRKFVMSLLYVDRKFKKK